MQLWIFLAKHTTWKESWGETFEVIRKKVLSDAQTHGYITAIDDIANNWNGYDWYNTGLNPVRTVSFIYAVVAGLFLYKYLAACFLLCWPMFWKWSLLTNGSCFGRSLQIPPFLSFTVYFQCLHDVCCGIKGGGEEYGEHKQWSNFVPNKCID